MYSHTDVNAFRFLSACCKYLYNVMNYAFISLYYDTATSIIKMFQEPE